MGNGAFDFFWFKRKQIRTVLMRGQLVSYSRMQRPEAVLVERHVLQAIDDDSGLLVDQKNVAVTPHQFDDEFQLLLIAQFIEVPEREDDDSVIAQLVNALNDCTFQFFSEHHTEVWSRLRIG